MGSESQLAFIYGSIPRPVSHASPAPGGGGGKAHIQRYCLRTHNAQTVRELGKSIIQFHQGRLTTARLVGLCSPCRSGTPVQEVGGGGGGGGRGGLQSP